MKIGELTKLLEGIALGLADVAKQPAQALNDFGVGIQPFADQTIDQFTNFLRHCEEFRRTGIITTGKKAAAKPKAGALNVADAVGRVRSLLGEINQGTVTSARIDALMAEFTKGLSKPQCQELLTSLDISGKSKTKGQAVDKVKQVLNSQLEMHVKAQAIE